MENNTQIHRQSEFVTRRSHDAS